MSQREKAALLVPYTPEEMFDLVIDVEHYPEFLPGYIEAKIVSRTDAVLVVEQRVGIGLFSVTFSSEARYERPRRIEIRSSDEPFDLLRIRWWFEPATDGARVHFNADARLTERLASRLLRPWFDHLDHSVPAAFVNRARELYGQREGPGPR